MTRIIYQQQLTCYHYKLVIYLTIVSACKPHQCSIQQPSHQYSSNNASLQQHNLEHVITFFHSFLLLLCITSKFHRYKITTSPTAFHTGTTPPHLPNHGRHQTIRQFCSMYLFLLVSCFVLALVVHQYEYFATV